MLADHIVPHMYYDLRDLGVVFDKFTLSRNPMLESADLSSTLDSL